MKTLLLLLFTIICINTFGQNKQPKIWLLDDLLRIGYSKGISELESLRIDPIELLCLDSTLAKKIVDIEFKSSFIAKDSYSVRIYLCHGPYYTETLAKRFNDRYAAEKLFNYYKTLPKFIKSDTIYGVYNHLDDFLSILLFYNPKGLKEKLKTDFYEWEKLAQKAPQKIYPDKQMKPMSFMESMKPRKSDLYPDCNLLVFQLAHALKELNVAGFDDHLIAKLKQKQTYPYVNRYYFPSSQEREPLNFHGTVRKVRLNKLYLNILAFLKDSWALQRSIFQGFEYTGDVNIVQIIYTKNNQAYIHSSFSNGAEGYLISLKGYYLTIENLWQLTE
jgi:hypothetical protein